ncbi:MAG: LysR family transcriptional regulator [Betaproteobacteria bacterium]|nr:LysR family transcriptional regulator [Betaproteobacteria bacterium]
MNERDLDYFAVVAEHGHLGRASEALGLTQPALSMSLRRLEKSMQAKLVKGTPKGVELTAVGRALQSHLQRLRLVRQDVYREIADLGQGRAGDVSISTQVGVTEDLVALSSAVLLNEAPKIALKVAVTSLETMVLALRNGDLDFIVSSSPSVPADDLAHEHLHEDEFVVIASTAHRLAGRRRVTLAEVASERWVRPGASGPSWDAFTHAFERGGVGLPQFTMTSNSSVVRRRVIAYAGFLGQSTRRAVRQIGRSLPLTVLPIKELTIPRSVMVTYRRDAYLSPAARRFIEILKTTAREIAGQNR